MPQNNIKTAADEHTSEKNLPADDSTLARFIEQNEQDGTPPETAPNGAAAENRPDDSAGDESADNVSYLTDDNKVVDFDPCDPNYLEKEEEKRHRFVPMSVSYSQPFPFYFLQCRFTLGSLTVWIFRLCNVRTIGFQL